MNQLYAEFKDRGLLIVGVSDEGNATLEKWVSARNVTYPVVNAPRGTATYAIGAYPTKYSVDERGKLIARGELDKRQIEERLQRVRWLPDLGPTPLAKSLRDLWHAGKLAELDKKLTAAASDDKLADDETARVQKLRGLFDKARESAQKDIADAPKGPDFCASEERLREIERLWASTPLATDAKNALTELRKDKRALAEIDASRKLREALARLGNDKKQMVTALQAFVKKYPDTLAAKQAQEMLKSR